MKDFLGQPITINAPCVYMKNVRTGSSTTRKILHKGTIVSTTPCKVCVRTESKETLVFPEDIVQTVRVFDDSVIASVMTPHGAIEARVTNDPEYPGISLEYVDNDDKGKTASRPTVLMEQPRGENVRALLWSNPNSEDYTDEIEFENTK